MKNIIEFEDYCITPGFENSGKAKSYVKSIQYLCDFLEIHTIDNFAFEKIKQSQVIINDTKSEFYNELLIFLTQRGQKSYLVKGFISAALKYFLDFWNKN